MEYFSKTLILELHVYFWFFFSPLVHVKSRRFSDPLNRLREKSVHCGEHVPQVSIPHIHSAHLYIVSSTEKMKTHRIYFSPAEPFPERGLG